MNNRIPYKITGGQSFFSRAEIKDIMAYFRLAVNSDDDNALLRIINVPRRGIGPQTLEKIGKFAHQQSCSLFEACCHPGIKTQLSTQAFHNIQAFVELINKAAHAVDSEGETATDAVASLLHNIHYEDWLFENSPSTAAAEMRIRNVNELHGWVTGMLRGSDNNEPLTLSQVVSKLMLRDMLSRQEDDDDSDQVQLMTLHASKGLEFPYVFLVGMEEGLLPHQSSVDEGNLEEERRLAYVGITRAQRKLTFTVARERQQYGEVIRPEVSRFLHELPQDDLEWEGDKKKPLSAEEQDDKNASNIERIRKMLRERGSA